MQKILDKLVENVREDIPGYIAISIAEMASENRFIHILLNLILILPWLVLITLK
ncbi:hypothetical protein PJW08_00955 [Tenacibaculum finnmarkense]|nr:hypothetical protein PJW08_00955 [Tenacibaculum finnmarkense]